MVVNTNVLAYALLGVEEFRDKALAAITRATEVWAPESLKAEMVKTVWQWVHFADAPLETGLEVLRDTEFVVTHPQCALHFLHVAGAHCSVPWMANFPGSLRALLAASAIAFLERSRCRLEPIE